MKRNCGFFLQVPLKEKDLNIMSIDRRMKG
jgi:hypothetical protein